MSVTTHGMLTECHGIPHSSSSHGFARFSDLVAIWRKRSQERQAFSHLDYRELRDIGLSQWEVESELAKPFWRE